MFVFYVQWIETVVNERKQWVKTNLKCEVIKWMNWKIRDNEWKDKYVNNNPNRNLNV